MARRPCEFCVLNSPSKKKRVSDCPFCDYYNKAPEDLPPFDISLEEEDVTFECTLCDSEEDPCAFCNYFRVQDEGLGIVSLVRECDFCRVKVGGSSGSSLGSYLSWGLAGLSPDEIEELRKELELLCLEDTADLLAPSTLEWSSNAGNINGKLHQKQQRSNRYKCMDCPFSCLREDVLWRHMQSHLTRTRTYPCPLCPGSFKNRQNLKYHLMTHTGEAPFSCKYCSFSSTQQSSVTIHERRHTGEKPYVCGYCDYSCISSSYLLLHERRHRGEKLYKCTFCSFSCVGPSDLRIHERRHTGERPYTCSFCAGRFLSAAHLIVHERRHQGQKPYGCSHCSYRSVSSTELKTHMRVHAEEMNKPNSPLPSPSSAAPAPKRSERIRLNGTNGGRVKKSTKHPERKRSLKQRSRVLWQKRHAIKEELLSIKQEVTSPTKVQRQVVQTRILEVGGYRFDTVQECFAKMRPNRAADAW